MQSLKHFQREALVVLPLQHDVDQLGVPVDVVLDELE